MPRALLPVRAILLLLLISAAVGAQRTDTTVVQAGAPLHPGVGLLVEELTVGAGSDSPVYSFSTVTIWGSHDGGVYVMDITNPLAVAPPYDMTVRRYDRAGRFVRAYGRTGQGPGEYALINQVTELADGRLLVSDRSGRSFPIQPGSSTSSTGPGPWVAGAVRNRPSID
jgi:hypothetical protein